MGKGMKRKIEELSVYGVVKSCTELNNTSVVIVLTEGFDSNMIKTFEFLNKCVYLFPNYPVVNTTVTDDNFALVILSK